MAFPSADFTFSCAGPLLAQQQYDTDMDIDMTSALFSSDPCLDEYFEDEFDTYFNFPDYDDVQDAESPASLPSSPSSTDTDSDDSYPDTLPLEDVSSFAPSPAISPSLLSSPSPSPALPHTKVPTVLAIEDGDIDAEGEIDDGSEFEDSDSDESFDPEEELRAVRNRNRAQQSRIPRCGSASSSSKPPRAKQYKSKQSSRRGSSSPKSTRRARSRSSSASRTFDSPIKPRYRYCKPRARQVSVEEYREWLKDPRAKNFKCPYKCGYSQDRSPDLYRHIDTHHQTARGTAFVCCGVPISELPALLPKDGSVSDYQLYEYQGGLWAGGCFQVISRKDAMLRHWGLHANSETDKKKKCKCIPTNEMVEINLHEHRLV